MEKAPISCQHPSSFGPTPEMRFRSSGACPARGGVQFSPPFPSSLSHRSGSASSTSAAAAGAPVSGLAVPLHRRLALVDAGSCRRERPRPATGFLGVDATSTLPDCLPQGASSGTSVRVVRLIVSPMSVASRAETFSGVAPSLVLGKQR